MYEYSYAEQEKNNWMKKADEPKTKPTHHKKNVLNFINKIYIKCLFQQKRTKNKKKNVLSYYCEHISFLLHL